MKVVNALGIFILIVVALGLLISWPMMLLWNGCLVPAMPFLQEVGLLQMWGIIILFSVLFKPVTATVK
jgi:hypothetical protein